MEFVSHEAPSGRGPADEGRPVLRRDGQAVDVKVYCLPVQVAQGPTVPPRSALIR